MSVGTCLKLSQELCTLGLPVGHKTEPWKASMTHY